MPRDDVSDLTQLGSKATDYKQDGPKASMLESFPNQYPEAYIVTHTFGEFTSLCPKTGQPDFARLFIKFIPHERCVETKSLKLYLFAFRNEGTFMETICNVILRDLIVAIDPAWIKVEMEFAARGGIATTVECEHTRNPGE